MSIYGADNESFPRPESWMNTEKWTKLRVTFVPSESNCVRKVNIKSLFWEVGIILSTVIKVIFGSSTESVRFFNNNKTKKEFTLFIILQLRVCFDDKFWNVREF